MLEGLTWIRDNREAYCVTFARGLDETELLRRFGGDLAWARMARYDDWEALEELRQFGNVVQVGWCDNWVFVYEDNGYRGTLSEVLPPLSVGTVAVSVYCNINAVTCFCYAEDGTIIAQFEPGLWSFEDASPRVQALMGQAGMTRERIEKEVHEKGFYDSVEMMFALAEAAGVRLDRASIAEKPLLTSVISNPVSDFVKDLLDQGVGEQIADRLLALLGNTHGYGYQEYGYTGYGWNLLDILRHGLPKKQRLFHPDEARLRRLGARAEELLRTLLSAGILPVLLKALDEGDYHLQSTVIELLSILVRFDLTQDDEAMQERLLALASAPEPLLKALEDLRKGPLVPDSHSEYLRQSLAEKNRRLRSSIAEIVKALIEFEQKHDGEEARKRLLALASASEAEVASPAAITLGTLGDQRAVEPLLRVLDRYAREEEPAHMPYPSETEALQLLGQLRVTSITEKLLNLLRSPSDDPDLQQDAGGRYDVRRQIGFQRDLLAALGQIGGAPVIERLLPLLNPQAQTQYACSFQRGLLAALSQTGGSQIAPPLLKLLNPRPEANSAFDFQLRLLEALGKLGDQRAIKPMAYLLNPDAHHPYEWIFQEYLIKALRQLGDTRAELQVVESAFEQWSKTTQRVTRVSFVQHPQNQNPAKDS